MLSKYFDADPNLPLLRRQFVSKTSALRDEIFRGVLPSDPVKSVSEDAAAGVIGVFLVICGFKASVLWSADQI